MIPNANTPVTTPLSAEAQAVLAQLHDIQLPEAIGWWPPSHLLLVVIVGVSGLLMWAIWYQWYRYQMNLYRKEALNQLSQQYQQADSPQNQILAINSVLKQVAITNYGRNQTASLTGQEWITFLRNTATYIDQPERLLVTLQSAYHHDVDPVDLAELHTYAQAWIKGHHK